MELSTTVCFNAAPFLQQPWDMGPRKTKGVFRKSMGHFPKGSLPELLQPHIGNSLLGIKSLPNFLFPAFLVGRSFLESGRFFSKTFIHNQLLRTAMGSPKLVGCLSSMGSDLLKTDIRPIFAGSGASLETGVWRILVHWLLSLKPTCESNSISEEVPVSRGSSRESFFLQPL